MLINNTDYPRGISFTSIRSLADFIGSYYHGQPGDQYWETWSVTGDYPSELFDVLDPPEAEGMNWHIK